MVLTAIGGVALVIVQIMALIMLQAMQPTMDVEMGEHDSEYFIDDGGRMILPGEEEWETDSGWGQPVSEEGAQFIHETYYQSSEDMV